MLELNHFRADLDEVMGKIKPKVEEDEYAQLRILRDQLFSYQRANQVKINHSVMELICAKHLIQSGFNVELEHMIDKVSCDVFGTKGFGTALVEVDIMQIPPALTKPPRFRTDEEIAAIKKLCDLYYTSPPVSIEEIRNARLHSIYAIDVDNVSVREWEVNEYLGKAALWSL